MVATRSVPLVLRLDCFVLNDPGACVGVDHKAIVGLISALFPSPLLKVTYSPHSPSPLPPLPVAREKL